MARILYGVCGEGRGHATRSQILIHHLKKHHDVCIVAGGRAYDLLSKDFETVEPVVSARFVYRNGRVDIPLTILRTLYRSVVSAPYSYWVIKQLIQSFQPDVVLSDAEPLCFYAAHASGIKRISIDNPHALLYRKYSLSPSEVFSWCILISAMKVTLFNADCYIVYDFFNAPSSNPRVVFFKPLIQPKLCRKKPREGDHIFVYQTTFSSDRLIQILRRSDEQFLVYGKNIDLVDGNVIFRRFNESVFFDDIASAKAIVGSAGFTLISEALYLKKPLFVVPVKGQFEQVVNGKFVEQLGVGVSNSVLREEDMMDFVNNLEVYKAHLEQYDSGDQVAILEGVERKISEVISS